MQRVQFDEDMIKLITEVVLRVLAEMQNGQEAPPVPEKKPAAGGDTCPASVFIPAKGNGKNLITEREVMELVRRNQKELVCPKNTIITALAADRLKVEGITVIRQ